MNAQVTHTPGKLRVLFGGQTCSLYFDKKGDERAKDRILQLPRDNSLGDADPNVRFLCAMRDAANTTLAAIASATGAQP